jgi:hypothetical protein
VSKYSKQAQTALKLLRNKGQKMPLVRLVTGSYDPQNPSSSLPQVDQTCDAFGVVLPVSSSGVYDSQSIFDARLLEDSLTRQKLRFVMIAGLGLTFDPQALDILQSAEGNLRLLGATGLAPDGTQNILWKLGCIFEPQIIL